MRSVERQTLIALKARRTAFKVVTDFLHITDLDFHEGICTQCGAVLPEDTQELFPGLCLRCDQREREVTESARRWRHREPHSIWRPRFRPLYSKEFVDAFRLVGIVLLLLALKFAVWPP